MEVIAGPHQPIVVKSATSDAGRATLAREAERLRRGRHPGVVELLLADEDHLELAWAGTHTLDTCHPSIIDAAGILAAIASTVADLHGLGIIHGRLDPSHVVLGGDGRPRLCGLRGPRPSEGDPSPAEDVAAIGRLMDHLVGPGAEPEPIPERRWGKRGWTGYHRRSLQTLADHATDEDPARRPTARAIAAAIVEAVPEARLVPVDPVTSVRPGRDTAAAIAPDEPSPGQTPAVDSNDEAAPDVTGDSNAEVPGPTDGEPPEELRFLGLRIEPVEAESELPEPPPARRPAQVPPRPDRVVLPHTGLSRSATGLAVAVVVVVLGFAAVGLGGSGEPDPSNAAHRAASAGSSQAPRPTAAPTPIAPTPTKASRVCPTAPSPPIATALSADVNGDGCSDLVVVTGTSITTNGATYRVGNPGDHVSVGDWDCDGIATPGIVRPSTGEVFLFDGWAPTGTPLTSSPAADLTGAAELVAPPEGKACHGPSVRVSGGRVVAITAPPTTSSQGTGQ